MADHAREIGSSDLMEHQYLRNAAGELVGPTLQQAVFAGDVNPSQLVAVREIDMGDTPDNNAAGDCASPSPVNCDTAFYSQPPDAYTVTKNVDGSVTVTDNQSAMDLAAGNPFPKGDGIDTLWNIEDLRFCTANDAISKACTTTADIPVPTTPTVLTTPGSPTITSVTAANGAGHGELAGADAVDRDQVESARP